MPIIAKHEHYFKSIIWLILTICVFIVLLKLAFWQYDRGFAKEQRLLRIEQLNQGSKLTINEVMQLAKVTELTGNENINDFPVTVTGKFNDNYIFLLDNQVEDRQLGYRVLQIVQTAQYAVLVNLGWVKGSINRDILPQVVALSGQHQFSGHVRLIEQGITLQQADFSDVNWPLRVQEIDLADFSKLTATPLLPFVIYLDQTETIGYKKNWQPIVMPPEKHFAYSFQWSALAIAWLILMIVFRLKIPAKVEQII